LFSQFIPAVNIGCPKNAKPVMKVVPFINMAELTKSETNNKGATRAASLIRGASCGKGGVGDNAL